MLSSFPVTVEQVEHRVYSGRLYSHDLSFWKRTLVGVWFLANPEGYRCISQRFGIAISTAHSCVMDFNNGLTRDEVLNAIISMPTDHTILTATSAAFAKGPFTQADKTELLAEQ